MAVIRDRRPHCRSPQIPGARPGARTDGALLPSGDEKSRQFPDGSSRLRYENMVFLDTRTPRGGVFSVLRDALRLQGSYAPCTRPNPLARGRYSPGGSRQRLKLLLELVLTRPCLSGGAGGLSESPECVIRDRLAQIRLRIASLPVRPSPRGETERIARVFVSRCLVDRRGAQLSYQPTPPRRSIRTATGRGVRALRRRRPPRPAATPGYASRARVHW